MYALALAAALDELLSLPANARRVVVSIARAAELDSIVEVQGRVIEHLCARIYSLESRVLELEAVVVEAKRS